MNEAPAASPLPVAVYQADVLGHLDALVGLAGAVGLVLVLAAAFVIVKAIFR
jgi:hypothetical protein